MTSERRTVVCVFFCSGSARGSSSCAVLSFCFSFGPTSGWWLKMISMSSTCESVFLPLLSHCLMLFMASMLHLHGTKQTSQTFTYSPNQVSIQPLWRMERWDDPHPGIHHRVLQLHYILTGKSLVQTTTCLHTCLLGVECSCDSLNLGSFTDFSTFPYIPGPAAEPLLAPQGGVIYVFNCWNSFAPTHTFEIMSSSLCIFPSLQIGVLATLLTTISGVVSVNDIWGDEWGILLISLQVGFLCHTLHTEKKLWSLSIFLADATCLRCLCLSLTTSVLYLLFVASPRHLSCTLEPWSQSPLSAGWSLDMWFAETEPVSVQFK